jgi:uncharacterized protein YndB with AHSA1/START domain
VSRQVQFTVEARSAASPAEVYALLADGTTWPRWTPFGTFELEREGEAGGESAGAIRVFTDGRIRSREEVTELIPDWLISYRSLSGMPIRNHAASVRLAPAAGGTIITWDEQFEVTRPGTAWFIARALRRFVQGCADGLAAYAGASPEVPSRRAR